MLRIDYNYLSEKLKDIKDKNKEKEQKSKILFVLIIILSFVFLIIFYLVYSILNKLEIREYFQLPKIKYDSYLDVSFSYPDFTNSSSFFTFPMYVGNEHQSNISLSITSELYFLTSKREKLVIDKVDINDEIYSGSKKRFDISFKKVFDNSIISGMNFCEVEKPLIEISPRECYKGESYSNKICWEDCKLYSLDFSAGKSLYCSATPRISTIINYETKISGVAEIKTNSLEDRVRWNVRRAPITVYLRPSPLPYNNLLPLDLGIELDGSQVFVKKIKIKVINYSLELETFFEKRIETVKSEKECLIDVNRWIDGKVYLSKENGFECTIQPYEIEIKKITGGKVTAESLNVNKETQELIERICGKNYKENMDDCVKKLKERGYSLCSIYSELGICKYESEKLDEIILLIEVEILAQEKYEKRIELKEC